jgi:hypothetical protein
MWYFVFFMSEAFLIFLAAYFLAWSYLRMCCLMVAYFRVLLSLSWLSSWVFFFPVAYDPVLVTLLSPLPFPHVAVVWGVFPHFWPTTHSAVSLA